MTILLITASEGVSDAVATLFAEAVSSKETKRLGARAVEILAPSAVDVSALAAAQRVDANYVAAENRRKKLLIHHRARYAR